LVNVERWIIIANKYETENMVGLIGFGREKRARASGPKGN